MTRVQQGYIWPMTPEDIQAMLESHLPDCTAKVVSDDNTHFEATVVSTAFAGKRSLQRHQMVYAALGDKMGGDIHALSIQALTPEESTAR
jgi:acid stress-induced BolA-like protein IbaG/YrbA